MESKFDWLTLTIKPENLSITFEDCFRLLGEKMLLTDLFSKMVPVPRVAFFDWCIGYENITLCCPSDEKFADQGICLRLSSQGLDYLTRYLKTYNITLKQWLGEWRYLCFEGYLTKDTRIDYAMDDIQFNGDKPIINMSKLVRCLCSGEMCKKGRVADVTGCDDILIKERYKTVNKEPVTGCTMNVGSRQSEVFCRFYDKLAEQKQKKGDIPTNCTSWTRCEFEFKGSKAMGVLNAFLDYSALDFAKYMKGVVNNYVSFVVRNNTNISRCPVKRWWAKFLGGCTEKFKLPHKEPSRSAYARARRGLRQYVPTVFTMYQELGLEGVYRFFEGQAQEMLAKKDIYKKELGENIVEDVLDYEEMNGFKNYQYNSFDGEEGWSIIDNIQSQHDDYFCAVYYARHLDDYDRERHDAFMNGCEVLY